MVSHPNGFGLLLLTSCENGDIIGHHENNSTQKCARRI
jgi:hypothetical protein